MPALLEFLFAVNILFMPVSTGRPGYWLEKLRRRTTLSPTKEGKKNLISLEYDNAAENIRYHV